MFKLSMFKMEKIQLHKSDFVKYNGHLPYLILSVLSMEDVRKRNEYLKKINLYETETKTLKFERRQDQRKLTALKDFLTKNPQFRDIIDFDKLMLL